ncbi:MAG: hypothetical protein JNN17_05550 [Verrucomicrobiaceae bacterium]|nr:hypothetical protein [Verrucomicrobiaceae bacterium]
MHFITTPTFQWLRQHVSRCRNELIVACPFVGRAFLDEVKRIKLKVCLKLITRTDLAVFAANSSDLDAVIGFASIGGDVRSLPRLHAKVYIVDRSVALVTSANATFSGMNRNLECGVEITGTEEVEQLAALAETGFGSFAIPQSWSTSSLETLKQPVSALRATMSDKRVSTIIRPDELVEIAVSDKSWGELQQGLPGWTKLTMSVVQNITEDTFNLQSIYRHGLPCARQAFPRNKTPREKLRQQLQLLRDMGVIEFIGGGIYRKLITSDATTAKCKA